MIARRAATMANRMVSSYRLSFFAGMSPSLLKSLICPANLVA